MIINVTGINKSFNIPTRSVACQYLYEIIKGLVNYRDL